MSDAGLSAVCSDRCMVRLRSDDIDDHAAALPGWEQRYSRLSAGAFEGKLSFLNLESIDVFRETTNLSIRQETMAPAQSVVIGLPLNGSDPAYFHGELLEPGDMIALSGGVPSEFLCCGRMDVGAVVIDRGALEQFGLSVPQPANGRFSTVIKASNGATLRRWLLDVLADTAALVPQLAGGREPASYPFALAHRGLVALAEALSGNPEESALPSQRRHRTASIAREIADATRETPLSVSQLASATGVSVRTLEQCFAEAMGMSPAVYLRCMRLNGARRMLQPGHATRTTVAEAATAWGFWHLGRFSAYYQSLFGESPSATLRGG